MSKEIVKECISLLMIQEKVDINSLLYNNEFKRLILEAPLPNLVKKGFEKEYNKELESHSLEYFYKIFLIYLFENENEDEFIKIHFALKQKLEKESKLN